MITDRMGTAAYGEEPRVIRGSRPNCSVSFWPDFRGLGAPSFEWGRREPSRPVGENPGRDERNGKQQPELSERRCRDSDGKRAVREPDRRRVRKLQGYQRAEACHTHE